MKVMDEAARGLRNADLGRRPLSLCPSRAHATRLEALGRRFVPRAAAHSEDLALAMSEGVQRIVQAIDEHFPANLFCDLEFLVENLLGEALSQPHPQRHLELACDEIVSLQALFGCGSAIRFRYVHDFLYGFDWAKWVMKAPEQRAGIRAFDLTFLRALRRRGHEMLELIAHNDEVYPQLADERPRNPFGFSREPNNEVRLHQDLARSGLIPVETWRWDAEPRWDRPYGEARRRRALLLSGGRHLSRTSE